MSNACTMSRLSEADRPAALLRHLLARAGRRVIVFEREKFPAFILAEVAVLAVQQ